MSGKSTGRKPSPIRTKVTALLAGNTKQKDIAKALNVSDRTVRRIAKQVRPELEEADRLLLHSRSHLKRILPARERVRSLKDLLHIAKITKQPAAGLAVIQYADKLDGIITPLDRLKVESAMRAAMVGYQGGEQRPIFMLESGASINVTVGHEPPSETPYPVDSQEIIDVEPSDDGTPPLESPRTGETT